MIKLIDLLKEIKVNKPYSKLILTPKGKEYLDTVYKQITDENGELEYDKASRDQRIIVDMAMYEDGVYLADNKFEKIDDFINGLELEGESKAKEKIEYSLKQGWIEIVSYYKK
jgi:hypothetical protein